MRLAGACRTGTLRDWRLSLTSSFLPLLSPTFLLCKNSLWPFCAARLQAPWAFGHETLKHLGLARGGGRPGTLLLPASQPVSGAIFISGQFHRADICLAQRKIVSATSSKKNDFLHAPFVYNCLPDHSCC